MAKNKNTFISFRLNDMETLQYAVFSENYKAKETNKDINFDFSFDVDSTRRIVRCIPKITLLQSNNPFLVLEVAFLFNLSEETWQSLIANNKITIPKALKEHFLVVSVGTLRGIVYEKTNKSKAIQKIVIPTLDVRTDTGDDLIFDLAENYNQEEE